MFRANVVFVPYHMDGGEMCFLQFECCRFLKDLITSISGLADIEWNVAIFDHVLNLSSHYRQKSANKTSRDTPMEKKEGTYWSRKTKSTNT